MSRVIVRTFLEDPRAAMPGATFKMRHLKFAKVRTFPYRIQIVQHLSGGDSFTTLSAKENDIYRVFGVL